MKPHRTRFTPLAAVIAALLLGSSLLVTTACCKKKADDWVVIHANRLSSSSTSGGLVDTCKLTAGKEVAWLPTCLKIEAGDKIGFANYYRDDQGGQKVIVKLQPTYFAVAQVDLDYGETTVVEVIKTPTQVFSINILVASSGHGGPVMIPKDDG